MRTTSGDLDPATAIMNTAPPLEEVIPAYKADLQAALAGGSGLSASVDQVRSKYFLAYNDDAGGRYASALSYTVPKAGDYMLIAGAALGSSGPRHFGRIHVADRARRPAGTRS